MLFDGPINGLKFLTYVEEALVPTLKLGDIVLIDNLGSHKGQAIRDAIRKARARLFFLPPYSPDLNPIEQEFAKLKTLLRKAAKRTEPGNGSASDPSENDRGCGEGFYALRSRTALPLLVCIFCGARL